VQDIKRHWPEAANKPARLIWEYLALWWRG